jgi:hypothetical protein
MLVNSAATRGAATIVRWRADGDEKSLAVSVEITV